MPASIRPYIAGLLTAALVTGSMLLLTQPRHDAIEVLIATPAAATIAVAVSGEVARPGVYQVPPGSRVADLLQLAGGVTERADPATPSRALLLRDEMQVHVPAAPVAPAGPSAVPSAAVAARAPAVPVGTTVAITPAGGTAVPVPTSTPAAVAGASTGQAAPEAPAGAPADTRNAPLGTPVSAGAAPPTPASAAEPEATSRPAASNPPTEPAPPVSTSPPVASSPTAPPAPAAARGRTPTPALTGPINLNAATAAELERLPGIGPALAGRIVADRQRNGPFRRIEDLDRVSGIGPATIARLRPLVTVE